MARTFVQQSQIRDTENKSDSSTLGADLENTTDLAADLNALRSLIKDIKGEGSWYEAASQDLAQIEAAMVVDGANADFQGSVKITGDSAATAGSLYLVGAAGEIAEEGKLVFASDVLSITGELDVSNGITVDAGGLTVTAGGAEITAGGMTIVEGGLDVQAGGATVAGDELLLEAADLTIKAATGGPDKFSVEAASGNTAIAGTLGVTGESTLASAIVSDLTDGRLVLAGTSGALQDEGGLTYSVGAGSVVSLALNGALDMEGNLDVGASFGVTAADGSMSAAAGAFAVGSDGNLAIATNQFTVSAAGVVAAAGDLSVASDFSVTAADGSMSAAGGELTIAADGALAIATDKFTVSAAGVVAAAGNLSVAADFSVTAADGSMSAAGGDFTVSAAGAVYAASDLDVGTMWSVTAADGSMSAADGKFSVAADGSMDAANGAFEVQSDGDLNIKDGTGATKFSVDASAGDVTVGNNLTVGGNLVVQGNMTTIDTVNLKVKDALIHLNIAEDGSVGGPSSVMDRGIMFHGDNSDWDDLGFGVKAGSPDFIFARGVDKEAAIDGDNESVLGLADLAAAWMSGVKLGAAEASEAGKLAYDGSGAAPVVRLESATDLRLKANGEDYSLAADADTRTLWDDQFGEDTSLVAAIMSLASGGSFKQGPLAQTAYAVDASIDFGSQVAELRVAPASMSTAEKDAALDVYLNGVRLVRGIDYEIDSVSAISLTEIEVLAEDAIFVRVNNPALPE